jgi:hypothetical protein
MIRAISINEKKIAGSDSEMSEQKSLNGLFDH